MYKHASRNLQRTGFKPNGVGRKGKVKREKKRPSKALSEWIKANWRKPQRPKD